MNDPQTTIDQVDAGKALADIGGAPPRVTPQAAPATTSAGTSPLDKVGQAFDPNVHAQRDGKPVLNAKGEWAKKRGNGALKAQGKPLAGLVIPPRAPVDGAAPAAATSSSAPTPGQSGVVDAALAPMPMLTEQDYEGTASGLTAGMFGILTLLFGDAWNADTAERDTWRGALRRLWFHYGLPRVGPIVEVLMLVPVTIAKRRDDAKTKQGFAKVKAWLGLGEKAKPAADAATENRDAA